MFTEQIAWWLADGERAIGYNGVVAFDKTLIRNKNLQRHQKQNDRKEDAKT